MTFVFSHIREKPIRHRVVIRDAAYLIYNMYTVYPKGRALLQSISRCLILSSRDFPFQKLYFNNGSLCALFSGGFAKRAGKVAANVFFIFGFTSFRKLWELSSAARLQIENKQLPILIRLHGYNLMPAFGETTKQLFKYSQHRLRSAQ